MRRHGSGVGSDGLAPLVAGAVVAGSKDGSGFFRPGSHGSGVGSDGLAPLAAAACIPRPCNLEFMSRVSHGDSIVTVTRFCD